MRAYRARLSLTPDELEAVHTLVKAGRQAHKAARWNGTAVAFDWGKLLDKVERARKRNATYPFDPDHVAMVFGEDSNETD